MDSRHLKLYDDELHFIRKMGEELVETNPKMAERLGLLGLTAKDTDPHIERLLEGFAFLTSRIQLQYQEEFPEFTQHLIDIIYPDFLSPIPSMSIVQFTPEIGLQKSGSLVARDTELKTPKTKEIDVECKFLTTHDVWLQPIEVKHASYLHSGDLDDEIKKHVHSDIFKKTQGIIKLTLETIGANIGFSKLSELKSLPIYLSGSAEQTDKLYESLVASPLQIIFHNKKNDTIRLLDKESLIPLAFEKGMELLPNLRSGFKGYRMLQEYFSLYKQFMFISLNNLKSLLDHFSENSLDIYILSENYHDSLESIGVNNFKLHCSPIINLFRGRDEEISITKKPLNGNKGEITHHQDGFKIINGRPSSHYEVFRVLSIKGVKNNNSSDRVDFHSLYSLNHTTLKKNVQRFYTLKRKPETRFSNDTKMVNDLKRQYRGNNIFISLCDNEGKLPYLEDIEKLSVKTLSTNRGIPYLFEMKRIQFLTKQHIPVDANKGICNIENFSLPQPSPLAGHHTWQLISLLSLNYLSITDNENGITAVKALKELLSLQLRTDQSGNSINKFIETQINEGIISVGTEKDTHAMFEEGRLCYIRGLKITVELKEEAFRGASACLFGNILDHFFAQYTSINSFTKTVIKTSKQTKEWPARVGAKYVI